METSDVVRWRDRDAVDGDGGGRGRDDGDEESHQAACSICGGYSEGLPSLPLLPSSSLPPSLTPFLLVVLLLSLPFPSSLASSPFFLSRLVF